MFCEGVGLGFGLAGPGIPDSGYLQTTPPLIAFLAPGGEENDAAIPYVWYILYIMCIHVCLFFCGRRCFRMYLSKKPNSSYYRAHAGDDGNCLTMPRVQIAAGFLFRLPAFWCRWSGVCHRAGEGFIGDLPTLPTSYLFCAILPLPVHRGKPLVCGLKAVNGFFLCDARIFFKVGDLGAGGAGGRAESIFPGWLGHPTQQKKGSEACSEKFRLCHPPNRFYLCS